MESRSSGTSWQWFGAGAGGAAAGAAALVLDDLLAVTMLGYWLPVEARFVVSYLVTGLLLGLVVMFVARVLFSYRSSWGEHLGACLGAMYVPALLERILSASVYRVGAVGALALAVAVVLSFGVWVAVLTRWVPAGRRWWPLVAAAVATAALLAVNRNLVDLPTEPAALAADAGILVFGTAAALAVRWLGTRTVAMVAAALGVAAAVWAMLPEPIACPATASAASEDRPNLVLVVIDTLRQDVFRSVVQETAEGQALAQVLHDAAWFDNAISAAPWTAPSVGSILTGLYPEEHGFGRPVRDPSRPLVPLDGSVTTLAEVLGARGYVTAGVVTNNLLHPHSGVSRGFDSYLLASSGYEKLPLMKALGRVGLGKDEMYQEAAAMRRLAGRRLDRLTACGGPFFMWVHFMDPHWPLHHHPDLPADPAAADLPENNRLYREEVRHVLREVAAFFEMLQERGLWDSSVVVLVADHGEMFESDRHDTGAMRGGKPLLYGHGHALYEELVHVPLVIRPQGGLARGRHVKALASHVDLLPTFLDLLGIARPDLGKGRGSLAALLAPKAPSGPGARGRQAALVGATQRGPKQQGLRTRRRKLVVYTDGERPRELYDLRTDPGEQHSQGSDDNPLATRLEHRNRSLRKLWITPLQSDGGVDPTARERLEALGYLE